MNNKQSKANINMIANFLSAWSDTLNYVKNQHQFMALISCFGTPLMLILYSSFKERYKYIGEYSPNNNHIFEIGVISTLIPGAFFYMVYDETNIKALLSMILFVMFIISILFIFDLLIDKDKDNEIIYKTIFYLLFLFFIVTMIVVFMMLISMKNVDFTKWM